ncbi:MAG: GDSL family lipase [gamma proteobacterium symbiont of Ctena orbiculata]|uniref:SGNH/GDSL hydrolase family protein n=1 Tax=Candidatus Thiodiazotropha taylori TaxID=2792791 RepID=A0A944MEL7_9GAMM|nr:SGNH/GDSL hydrolase family protein [Candidatus Thiodiazotropha taylori]PUB88783.1 MAG: GDSL family lipase [gamma proteobacterium symbiont of Ctena orbiculata]MBT2989595.1 SGNH/GDSL hydrolase family protein [Candidatus Thiodiazotropha taylori]MBT2997175.1 SGNH/GDSL hydrolase family protein [Candidatus Thiodiazotropha taylori]MBT3001328.1 SGNH/GDSL hydrolase family protein [Candidatus Thiodiazotropha taylori]
MEQILIYADSLTWGIIPNTRERLAFDKRWPGVFEKTLLSAGKDIRVIENCLNGRRSAWPDPFKPGRDGSEGLAQVIEMHSPLKLVILMLGTNDFQSTHVNDAWLSAQGVSKLVNIIRQSPIEPVMSVPDILIVAPPGISEPKGQIADKFRGAEMRFKGLPDELEKVAAEQSTHFFNAGDVTESSRVDGIHLDEPQHRALGSALAEFALQRTLV